MSDARDETFDKEMAAAKLKAWLATTDGADVVGMLQQDDHVLLSGQAIDMLRRQATEAEEQTYDGRSEFLRMRLQLLENTRSYGLEQAWQRFTSDYLEAAEAIQHLQTIRSVEEISRRISEQPETYLTTPVLAILYSALEEHRASSNRTLISMLEASIRTMLDIKRGKIVVEKPYQQGDGQQKIPPFISPEELKQLQAIFPPGIVQDFDYNDPYFLLLTLEITHLTQEQVQALMPLFTQMKPFLLAPDTAEIATLSTRFLDIISREQTPYFWAMLQYSRVLGYLNQAPGSNQQALNDCNEALSIITREVSPQMWAYTHLVRGCVSMQPIVSEEPSNHPQEMEEYLEQAINDFDAALTFFTREKMPLHWATALGTRGFAYVERERITGQRISNLERALADFNASMEELMAHGTPGQVVIMYIYRAMMYFRLAEGNRGDNIELAITDCTRGLALLSTHAGQEDIWQQAMLFHLRGLAYLERAEGERRQNLELGLADFQSALHMTSREDDPREWARRLVGRGNAYMARLEGERRKNLELALEDYNRALEILNAKETPLDWARTVMNRGICFSERMMGDRGKNQEQGLADLSAALTIFDESYSRLERGIVLTDRGSLYLLRIAGERPQNFSCARKDFDSALPFFFPEQTPLYWAKTLINRSMAYQGLSLSLGFTFRGAGFRHFAQRLFSPGSTSIQSALHESEQFFEQALDDLNNALTVLSPETTPHEWGIAMRERAQANAYRLTRQFTGNREETVQQAIDDFGAALTVLSPTNAPIDWAITHINRAVLYQQRIQEKHPEDAARGLADTEKAMTIFTREVAPANYRRIQDIRARIFEELGHWEEAHAALLAAREVQRDLVATATSSANRSDIIAEFALADTYVRDARAMLHLHPIDLAEIAIALEEGRAQSMRAALDLDSIALEKISDAQAQARARAFLAARQNWRKYQHQMLEPDSPHKETDARKLQDAYNTFLQAREAIRQHDNPDFMTPEPTLPAIARALHGQGEALVYLVTEAPLTGTNGMAVIVTLDSESKPRVTYIRLPQFKDLDLFDLMEIEAANAPSVRIRQAVENLGALGLNDLARELSREGIGKVILIAYGWAGVFPLAAALVTDQKGKRRPLGEVFEVTFVPSAAAAARAYERSQGQQRNRSLLLIAGNPVPHPLRYADLPFAAAEADTIQHIAQEHGYPAHQIRYLKPREATRARVVEALQHAWYAHMAVHGDYQVDDPRSSHLLFAGSSAIAEKERTITLGEALDGAIDLSGLRLLVLSACETAIIDMRRVPDEMLGLAFGFLQAGVSGVIAALWAVDDHATYLLMSRFAQLYLDAQGLWTPARALAEAQRWLREEATNRLLATYDASIVQRIKEIEENGEGVTGSEQEKIVSRPRSLRLSHEKALSEIQVKAHTRAQTAPDQLPYADPVYWAGFMVTGC